MIEALEKSPDNNGVVVPVQIEQDAYLHPVSNVFNLKPGYDPDKKENPNITFLVAIHVNAGYKK